MQEAEIGLGKDYIIPKGILLVRTWDMSSPGIVPLRERSNVRQVAFIDPNSPADQAERRALIPDLLERLEDEGYPDLAERLDRNPYLVIPTDAGRSPELVLGLFALDHYRPPVAVVLIAPRALR